MTPHCCFDWSRLPFTSLIQQARARQGRPSWWGEEWVPTPQCEFSQLTWLPSALPAFPTERRLIDGANITMEDEHMWLIPFSPGLDHVVTIRFDRAESIAGLRFWNYNKSPEDTYRGVSRGTAAALGPLSEKQRLDEWLVWLPERSINPLELSKWSWGRLPPGSERAAAVSFFCKQQMQVKEPRADSGYCSASCPLGVLSRPSTPTHRA